MLTNNGIESSDANAYNRTDFAGILVRNLQISVIYRMLGRH